MPDYTIKINDVSIDHGSSFINHGCLGCGAANEGEAGAALRELREIRERLSKTEPILAEAVSKLEEAIQTKDKRTISKIAKQLSIGTASSLFANLASAGLLTFLGIK